MADPAARIAETRERTTKVRNEKSTPYIQIIAGAMNLMPRWYIGSVLRKVDFLASDVPGVPVPVFPSRGEGQDAVRLRADHQVGGQRDAADLRGHLHAGHRRRHRGDPSFDLFCRCLIKGFDEVLALAK